MEHIRMTYVSHKLVSQVAVFLSFDKESIRNTCVCEGNTYEYIREKPPFDKEHIWKRNTCVCQREYVCPWQTYVFFVYAKGAFLKKEKSPLLKRNTYVKGIHIYVKGLFSFLRADSRDMSHKLVSHVAVFLLFDKERFSFLRADSRGTPISRGRNTYVSQGAFLFPLSYVTQISESCRCRSTRKAKRALMAIKLNTHTHTQREGGREREKDTHTHAHTRTRT